MDWILQFGRHQNLAKAFLSQCDRQMRQKRKRGDISARQQRKAIKAARKFSHG